MINKFKEKNSFERRQIEAANIIKKYPERIPIIVQKDPNSELPEINKIKYLVPKDMTMSQFIFTIRKRVNINSSEALFIWVNNGLVTSSKQMAEIYSDEKDKDGFLYINYTNENTFG